MTVLLDRRVKQSGPADELGPSIFLEQRGRQAGRGAFGAAWAQFPKSLVVSFGP
jgi:hypothetical protein